MPLIDEILAAFNDLPIEPRSIERLRKHLATFLDYGRHIDEEMGELSQSCKMVLAMSAALTLAFSLKLDADTIRIIAQSLEKIALDAEKDRKCS